MFFSLARQKLVNYPVAFEVGCGFFLNCDKGWREVQLDDCRIIYKGYWEEDLGPTEFCRKLIAAPEPRIKGNFLAFLMPSSGEITLTFSRDRATPIYFSLCDTLVTNLPKSQLTPLKHYQYLVVNLWEGKINFKDFDPFGALNNSGGGSSKDIVSKALELLNAKFQRLKKWTGGKKVRLFLSGGLDTLTLLALLRSNNVPHELVFNEYFQYDDFTAKNRNELEAFWSYKQMHHWDTPEILVSGSNGDESLMRNPRTGSMLLLYQGVSVLELLETSYCKSYSSRYLNRTHNLDKLKILTQKQDEIRGAHWQDFCHDLLIKNYMDFQHWHLGKTITFTPFKDIDLVKLMLSADSKFLTDQFFDGRLNKEIISELSPGLLKYLSSYKNHNSLENCVKLLT